MREVRRLVYEFRKLPFHARVQIIKGYGLEWNNKIKDQENFKLFFKHIGEKNLFNNLAERMRKYV